MSLTEVVTIGAYGWQADDFFRALQAAGVDTFCDVRARRGVRGSQYAFANSRRLQASLAALGIGYLHRPDLAPDQATRQSQYAADHAAKVTKRGRAAVSGDFAAAYEREVLAGFDPQAFVASLGPEARVAALFCVEARPAACHRSLLAGRLAGSLGLKVTHLTPPELL